MARWGPEIFRGEKSAGAGGATRWRGMRGAFLGGTKQKLKHIGANEAGEARSIGVMNLLIGPLETPRGALPKESLWGDARFERNDGGMRLSWLRKPYDSEGARTTHDRLTSWIENKKHWYNRFG